MLVNKIIRGVISLSPASKTDLNLYALTPQRISQIVPFLDKHI